MTVTALGRLDAADGSPAVPAVDRPTRTRRRPSRLLPRSFAVTFLATVIVAAFLAPLLQSVLTSLKSPEQTSALNSPLYPADIRRPTTSRARRTTSTSSRSTASSASWRCVTQGPAQDSDFVDPANPDAGLINWVGAWRTLDQPWQLAPQWSNYGEVWDLIDFPLLLRNTILIALIGTTGTVVSCTLVAYGLSRFRFPGRNLMLLILIATIFLPSAVTLIPTYTIFVKLGWVGTWLPLLVPTFFANAYDVFLLRQYLMTIPPELDEAAAIDGAGPFRTLCLGDHPAGLAGDHRGGASSTSCIRGTTSSGR